MTKKILAMLLAVLMVAALATGCSGSGTTSATSTASTASTTSTASTASTPDDTSSETPDTPAGGVDLSEHRDVSILVRGEVFITDYEDNYLTKKLEDDLNCTITIDPLPAGDDGLTRVQMMVNGGDELPDIFSLSLSSALTYEYGSGGTLVKLNDYYDDPGVMPNFNSVVSEEDAITMRAAATSADGNIYCLTMWQPEPWNFTPYRMFINRTWMDNLGIDDMPTTTDELKDILVKFANDDPNGNGIKDEIAVFANYVDEGNYGCNVILNLINFFEYSQSMSSLTLSEDGKTVIAPQTTDNWKEAMKYMHDLYLEGAITDNSFIPGTDTTSYKGTLNWQGIGTEPAEDGKSINIVGFFAAGSNGSNFAGSGNDTNVNFLEYNMMPVVSSPVSEGYVPYYAPSGDRWWFVTEYASDPEFCTYMGDYFYDHDMSVIVRWGSKGDPVYIEGSDPTDVANRWESDWTDDPTFCADWYEQHTALIASKADKGAVQLMEDYQWVALNTIWSSNTNHYWHNVQPRYMPEDEFSYHWGSWVDPETYDFWFGSSLGPSNQMYYTEAHPDYILPPLEYTDDEQSQISETQINYPNSILQWTMDFITGAKDVDGDWQAYLDDLDYVGLQTYLEASQAAYERTLYYQANFG